MGRDREREGERERDSSKLFKTQRVCNHLRGRRDVFMWEEKVIIRTLSQRELLFLCGGCLPPGGRVCRTLHVDWVQVEPSEQNKSGVMRCEDNSDPLRRRPIGRPLPSDPSVPSSRRPGDRRDMIHCRLRVYHEEWCCHRASSALHGADSRSHTYLQLCLCLLMAHKGIMRLFTTHLIGSDMVSLSWWL